MAKQTILWTILPNGKRDGRWCVSVVVSPRLTPGDPAENMLGHAAWAMWADWPTTMSSLQFEIVLPNGTVALERSVTVPQVAPDSALWRHLIHPSLPVEPLSFPDMAKKNLRSYPVRTVLGLLRSHYAELAQTAGDGEHPVLLPWAKADPALRGLLGALGTETKLEIKGHRQIETLERPFGRFHTVENDQRVHDQQVDSAVFTPDSCRTAQARLPGTDENTTPFPLRALPNDWKDPTEFAASDERAKKLMALFQGRGEYALWQADRFYSRTLPTGAQQKMRRPTFVGGEAPPQAPVLDFHKRIASYGDHPHLMRRLGLVVDFVLAKNDLLDALVAAAPHGHAADFMRLSFSDPSGSMSGAEHAEHRRPWTAFSIRGERFRVRERTRDHAEGLLRLAEVSDQYKPTSNPYDLYHVDPDGASLKTANFVLTTQNLIARNLTLGAHGAVTYTTGDRQPVTNLRSAGIGISRHGRAEAVAANAATAALNHAAIENGVAKPEDEVTLFAEDVLRGYRVDIWDATDAKWRSLMQRTGRYRALARDSLSEVDVGLPPDEGSVKGASTTSSPTAPDDHYLHESLFRWTGWSLAAPRPGRTVRSATVDGTHLQVEEVVDVPTESAPHGNGLGVSLQVVKGSLPRLRFGRSYRVRARTVDLAGNSLHLEEPGTDEQATLPVTYGRFEPVDPPALVLASKVSEGESLERAVIRSNFDQSTVEYQQQIEEKNGSLHGYYDNVDFEYHASSCRHVVPPKSSQQQCELHGMFDDAVGATDPARIKTGYAVAARENGSLLHPVAGADIELVTPKSVGPVATVGGDDHPAVSEASSKKPPAPPEQAEDTKDRFAAGQYLIHREAIVPVPYLPDPASGGIALEGVPGLHTWIEGKHLVEIAPGLTGYALGVGARAAVVGSAADRLILLLDFDHYPTIGSTPHPWPDAIRSLRLELHEQPKESESPDCDTKFTVADPPLWDHAAGALRMFLPKGHVARIRYSSFVRPNLVEHLGLPRWQASTEKRLRLQAEAMAGTNWMLTPWRNLVLVHATQQPVCEPRVEQASVERKLGSQYADLQAADVVLHGPSTGSFEIVGTWSEWVDDPAMGPPKRVDHQAVLHEIRLGEMHRNRFSLKEAVDEQTNFVPVGGQLTQADVNARPAVPGNRHEFGDTRFRFVQYHLNATTRFREYLPPDLFADHALISRAGPVIETHRVQTPAGRISPGAPVEEVSSGGTVGTIVPASAPPDVPRVLYVVPTFRWDRSPGRSVRRGDGLRVYLERPWFSSGDGELLGVVLQPEGQGFQNLPTDLVPYVTQWGSDPLWDASRPKLPPRAGQFPKAVWTSAVTLLEDGVSATVAGHQVHFDDERGLWYCDIVLETSRVYVPFVRLSLARVQRYALQGAHVSRTVLCDFAQLLPWRVATVESASAGEVQITVHGPAPRRGPMRRKNDDGASESPYIGVALVPDSPDVDEDGRNRMEAVLQRQALELEGELGWEDVKRLGNDLVGRIIELSPPPPHTPHGGGLHLGSPIWSNRCLLPPTPPGWRYRVQLREFERYYADSRVDAPHHGALRKPVEERLVYAEAFPV